ncbi:hypothetical protein LI90_1489 [Carbonactinospora thermoautotrophica]|uniref:Uncharacterized protein n=1 Tax=Carbonactinospora thermoautotrophica TaxID=1469144 RepID=A0A132MPR7_9ACTN|nr:hypothetical protein LI90_1489 [Carbonactinospora thermoautotrophica]
MASFRAVAVPPGVSPALTGVARRVPQHVHARLPLPPGYGIVAPVRPGPGLAITGRRSPRAAARGA